MNERIEKLVEQAKTHVLARIDEDDSDWDDQHTVLYNQKFAELIVREMYQVMKVEGEQFSLDQNFDAVKGVGQCMRKIKEHFGVEE